MTSSLVYLVKQTWPDHLIDDYHQQQHIHLPNCNELFYEKQSDEHPMEYDRFSTITYQHVKDTNDLTRTDSDHVKEEVCVLYFGPHGRRGFEENHSDDHQTAQHPSKLSLLTLKSHSFADG